MAEGSDFASVDRFRNLAGFSGAISIMVLLNAPSIWSTKGVLAVVALVVINCLSSAAAFVCPHRRLSPLFREAWGLQLLVCSSLLFLGVAVVNAYQLLDWSTALLVSSSLGFSVLAIVFAVFQMTVSQGRPRGSSGNRYGNAARVVLPIPIVVGILGLSRVPGDIEGVLVLVVVNGLIGLAICALASASLVLVCKQLRKVKGVSS